jgi:thiamine-monophosphate kinase
VLNGGDDYELLFTLPPHLATHTAAIADAAGCAVHRIGEIVAGDGDPPHNVRCLRGGRVERIEEAGFDHFAR